ncbi:hypothetical protein [Pengzhenrongella sp.]|uniref:hypothetical protein n=1 Tax=Pengzhenrongella sp. TaxID=2888820 RepID=UPI002F92B7CB
MDEVASDKSEESPTLGPVPALLIDYRERLSQSLVVADGHPQRGRAVVAFGVHEVSPNVVVDTGHASHGY